jgi:capsular polysaccharide biosynthesis protein
MRSFVAVLSARRWLIAGAVVFLLLVSPLWVHVLQPTYVAVSEVALIGNGVNAVLPATDVTDLAVSTDVLERVVALENSKYSLKDIEKATSVRSFNKSNVLPITVKSKDASMALSVANAIAAVTVSEYRELAARQYDGLIDSLKAQLRGERDTIKAVDARLQTAVEHNAPVGTPEGLEAYSKRLADLEAQRSIAYSTYVADNTNAATLQSPEPSSKSDLASVFREQALAADPVYTTMHARESLDVADYESEKAGYQDAFPGLAGLKEKVGSEASAVARIAKSTVKEHAGGSPTYAQVLVSKDNAQALAAGDLARVSAIDGQIEGVQAKLKQLPIADNQLRLERDSAANAMEQLEVRYQQTLADKSQAGSINSLVLLDRATEAWPRIPQVVLATIVALLLFGFAIGVAYVAELVDPRIRTATEVELLYGSPRIG